MFWGLQASPLPTGRSRDTGVSVPPEHPAKGPRLSTVQLNSAGVKRTFHSGLPVTLRGYHRTSGPRTVCRMLPLQSHFGGASENPSRPTFI